MGERLEGIGGMGWLAEFPTFYFYFDISGGRWEGARKWIKKCYEGNERSLNEPTF